MAQQSVTVAFPDAGEREVWFGSAGSSAPTNVVPSKGTEVEVPIPAVDPKATLYALDKSTGNLASILVTKVKGRWAPKSFDQIGVVHVQVTHGAKPVAAAQIELQDPKRKQQEFLDPSSNGQVDFYAVTPGQLKVTVNYKTESKPASPVTQLFTLALKRTDIEPNLSVALPEKVEVVGGATPAAPNSTPAEKPEKKDDNPNLLGKAVVYLLGIGFVVGVVYFAIQYMKKNQDLVTSKLEDLGVQIPKPQSDGQPDDLPAAPPIPKQEPPQKIVLDNAQPAIIGTPTATPMPMATATLTGQPRLVADTGDELPLDEGELTVGRDAGLGLSLATESTVSRNHAALARTGSQVVVKDLGSTNGTYVNGVRISGETTLKPGDTVQFGAVRFRYEA